MRLLVQWLKRVWHTPVEFYGVDRPEPQAGPWHGLLLFVVLLVVLGLLWLIRYLPERTYLVELPAMRSQGCTAAREIGGGQRRGDTVTSGERMFPPSSGLLRHPSAHPPDHGQREERFAHLPPALLIIAQPAWPGHCRRNA
jgi:hypothetical protein